MREDMLLTGPLEPTNQWYAVAKIAGMKLCEAYRTPVRRGFHLGHADQSSMGPETIIIPSIAMCRRR